eukprot:TRINITY_DN5157_c0_g1_i4.p1 TRINITY_DN5157_c0_g1~~TRINITY_DN5157_c0_g1_i4.p1  ORF type:complete len:470 (+),score=118.06 TRINITY_DN5157_c0_g1_i4:1381-2790(+)
MLRLITNRAKTQHRTFNHADIKKYQPIRSSPSSLFRHYSTRSSDKGGEKSRNSVKNLTKEAPKGPDYKKRFKIALACSAIGLTVLWGLDRYDKYQEDLVKIAEEGDDAIEEEKARAKKPQTDILSLVEIIERIGAKEKKMKIKDSTCAEIHINTFASQSDEDRYSIEVDDNNVLYFMVADGHGGSQASEWAKENLSDYVIKELEHAKGEVDVAKSIRKAFTSADFEFLTSNLLKSDPAGLAGACINMVVLDKNQLYVANAGDSRAVLGTRNDESRYEATQLSIDQTAETEKDRIRAEHPNDKDVVVRGRIKGGLQPSRGLGDGAYKMMGYVPLRNAKTNRRQLPPDWDPPYTTADPEVKFVELNHRDEFVILATDGIWDALSSEEAVSIVSSVHRSSDNASTKLIRRALEKRALKIDSIDKRCDAQERLSAILNLPPGTSEQRRVHDDMTALVVYFNKKQIRSNADKST